MAEFRPDTTSTSEEEDAVIASCLLLSLPTKRKVRKHRKKREFWVRPWVMRRPSLGAYANLLKELANEDQQACTSFLRMGIANFNALLQKVEPLILKQDTVMREAISPGERLAVTLRYLASGKF
ncbi:nuclease harbi1-like protein [Elysia marginata]|uniref:Nuclease harbi1-like protein n=1 Tax=Elysia marginata TaxID=1093978 RepID=A0AAV4GM29_9GAST|nr:nuclease harbi1-like protein [Elysia marginata]